MQSYTPIQESSVPFTVGEGVDAQLQGVPLRGVFPWTSVNRDDSIYNGNAAIANAINNRDLPVAGLPNGSDPASRGGIVRDLLQAGLQQDDQEYRKQEALNILKSEQQAQERTQHEQELVRHTKDESERPSILSVFAKGGITPFLNVDKYLSQNEPAEKGLEQGVGLSLSAPGHSQEISEPTHSFNMRGLSASAHEAIMGVGVGLGDFMHEMRSMATSDHFGATVPHESVNLNFNTPSQGYALAA